MRVLIDEDLPIGLAKYLSPHVAEHVAQLGWKGKSNGDLLSAAVAAGFDEYWTKPIEFGPFLAGLDRIAGLCASATPTA